MLGDDWKGWQNFASSVLRPHSLHPGCDWKEHHAVVIESDDWGMCGEGKDREAHQRLSALGYKLDSRPGRLNYANTLETQGDLEALYRTLEGFKDRLGRSPVVTANFIVTNPDYPRIEEEGFAKYHFVPISEGFPGTWSLRGTALEVWRSGIRRKLVVPEYHGFSHCNQVNWMEGLRRGDKRLLDFFREEMVTSSRRYATVSEYGIAGPGGIAFESFWDQYREVAAGCEIFREAFGRDPRLTIPPHDVSDSRTLLAFAKAGMNLVQSERRTLTGILGLRPLGPRSVLHATARAITQLTVTFRWYRNVRLEPKESRSKDEATSALELSNRILRAGGPVIVGSHRQNYVAGVEPDNAGQGRRRLASFLAGLREDPKLVFLSSFEAAQLSLHGHSTERFGDEYLLRNYTRGDVTVLVQGARGHLLKDLTKDQPADRLAVDSDSGVKVAIPPGTCLALSKE